jgi:hypothetical protein
MAFFIFNLDNQEQPIYKIAENQSDLNNLDIDTSVYTIKEGSQEDFEKVKTNEKIILNIVNENINFKEVISGFTSKKYLIEYVDSLIYHTTNFLKNNKNHVLFSRWNDYNLQLKNFKKVIVDTQETTIENELKIEKELVLIPNTLENGKPGSGFWVEKDKEICIQVEKIKEPFLTLRNCSLERYFKNNALLYYSLLQLP